VQIKEKITFLLIHDINSGQDIDVLHLLIINKKRKLNGKEKVCCLLKRRDK